MKTKRVYRSFDYFLAAAAVMVAVFGTLLIGSATGIGSGTFSGDFKTQIIWAASGTGIMLLAAFIDYQFICRFFAPIYVVNIIFLIAVLAVGILTHANVYRWLGIGGFGIQPSEFAKIFMIIFLASFLSRKEDRVNKIHIFLAVVGLTALPAALIAIQPSLSASMVILAICVFMLFAAKLKYRFFAVGIALLIPLCALVYYDVNAENPIILDKLMGYQMNRLTTFFNPEPDSDEYYQTQQSLKAISMGKLTGKGLFKNDVYVPYIQNDFIIALLGSEFGFAGCAALLGAMLLIIVKCLLIAMRSPVFLGRLIAAGAAAMIFFQVFVNVGVATDMLPNTGMVFPFISSGGSSMWVSFACVGLALNVGMTKAKSMFEE